MRVGIAGRARICGSRGAVSPAAVRQKWRKYHLKQHHPHRPAAAAAAAARPPAMRDFENTITFEYPWHAVSTANWRKYCAWNTHSAHVVAVDTLSRTVDPDTGIVRSSLSTTQPTPASLPAGSRTN